eukprot:NODE_3_length_80033_cov_0.932970.p72 type:complete len:111 gc:universal NODE_3_length_80033_cov_0.932970:58664-58996(+)
MLMQTLGMKKERINEITDKIMKDFGNTNSIDFPSFCKAMVKPESPSQDKQDIEQAFYSLFGKQTIEVSTIKETLKLCAKDDDFDKIIEAVFPGDKINISQFIESNLYNLN